MPTLRPGSPPVDARPPPAPQRRGSAHRLARRLARRHSTDMLHTSLASQTRPHRHSLVVRSKGEHAAAVRNPPHFHNPAPRPLREKTQRKTRRVPSKNSQAIIRQRRMAVDNRGMKALSCALVVKGPRAESSCCPSGLNAQVEMGRSSPISLQSVTIRAATPTAS